MDITISKRGITLESLCRTSQNKWHAQLFLIYIMYINFHLDAFTTVVDVSDCINFHLDAFTTVVDVSD